MTTTLVRQSSLRLDGVVLALVALGLFTGMLIRHADFVHDDIFITLRYAQNLAITGYPHWNPGEWAEGYTSLIHVVLNGALIRLGVSPIIAAQSINGVAALGLLALTAWSAWLLRPEPEARLLRWLALIAVAVSPQIAIWVLGGLEAVLVAAFLLLGTAALLSALRTPSGTPLAIAAAAFSIAVLTRLDAAVFIAGAGAGFFLASCVGRSSHQQKLFTLLWPAALIVGIPAAVAFLQMAVRLNLYGEYFPLTFYAKVDLDLWGRIENGGAYLIRSLAFAPVVTVAVGALVIAALKRSIPPAAMLLSGPILIHLLYVIWSGGDHMTTGRFIVILVAPSALLLLALSSGQSSRVAHLWVGGAAAATVAVSLVLPPKTMDPAAKVGTIIGQHIEATWPRGITIALHTAGTTPFYASEGRVFIDMLGLNTPQIAKRENVPIITGWQLIPGHGKGDAAFVLAQAPERIILGPAAGETHRQPWFLTDFELSRSPEFFECYAQRVEMLTPDPVLAARGEPVPEPMPFVWYERICP